MDILTIVVGILSASFILACIFSPRLPIERYLFRRDRCFPWRHEWRQIGPRMPFKAQYGLGDQVYIGHFCLCKCNRCVAKDIKSYRVREGTTWYRFKELTREEYLEQCCSVEDRAAVEGTTDEANTEVS